MGLSKKIIKEPLRILVDIFYFFDTGFKKPVSFFFNFLFPYQNLRIKIDAYFTNLYQKRFIKLEKDSLRKKHLEKMYNEGVIKIENFYDFQNKELIMKLTDEGNKQDLENLLEDTKKKVLDKMIYYLSFLRGETFNSNSLYFAFQLDNKINHNDNFHSDVFSHSSKAFIYLNDVDINGRPFLYMIGSHKDYDARNNLEKITNKSIYNRTSKYGFKSSRIEENNNYQHDYHDKYQKYVGLVKSGSAIFVDTSGFHAKGPGNKSRYTFAVGTKRKNLLNKFLSILEIKKVVASTRNFL